MSSIEVLSATSARAPRPREDLRFELWTPSATRLVPAGVSKAIYSVWWAFHHAGVFANRDYAVLLGWSSGTLVHTMGIFPAYFRFPFMAREDLQLGHLWTPPEHRGRGIATEAICSAVARTTRPGRRYWYLAGEDNVASIRAAERAGFQHVGAATRTTRYGLRLFGAFEIERRRPA